MSSPVHRCGLPRNSRVTPWWSIGCVTVALCMTVVIRLRRHRLTCSCPLVCDDRLEPKVQVMGLRKP